MPEARPPQPFKRRVMPLVLLMTVCLSLLGSHVLRAATPALSIAITDTRATTLPGESLTYTIRARNTGSVALSNVRIGVMLSSDVTFETASDNPTDLGGGSYQWTIASLAPGTTATRYLSAQVNAPLADKTIITTNASVDQVGDTSANMAADTTTITAGDVALAPTSLTFAEQVLGTTSDAQTVTFTNNGSAAVTINSIVASDDFAQTNDCAATIEAGASCTISVTFTPTASGERSGSLTFTTDALGSPHIVSLSGIGLAPLGEATPAALDFGAQRINTTSAAQTVTFTNIGGAPLTFSAIAISGDYSINSTTCSLETPLAVDASCTIDVVFTPIAGGTRTGTLTIGSDAENSPQTVSLTGVGVAPAASVSPTTLDFGHQRVATTSAAQTVTLTNSGTGPLAISGLTVNSAEWSQTNNCPATLESGANCTINVTFTPSATGARTGTLDIAHDATDSPTVVSLTGNGIEPQAAFDKNSLAFGDQRVGTTSDAQTVTLTNSGTGPMNISGITIDGPWTQTNDCSSVLAAGASCTFTITFAPTATGPVTGVLSVTDDAAGSPHTVSLSGTGVAPAITVDPTALDFGNQPVGVASAPKVVTITNSGTAPLTLNSLSITPEGAFALSSTNCPVGSTTLAAGASCQVNITFQPGTTGNYSATLTINNDAASAVTVPLTGVGALPGVSLSSTTLDFGTEVVGTTSGSQTVTLTNNGGAALTINSFSITPADEFATTSTTCPLSPATLPAGASCTIGITFTPSAVGSRTATLTVTSDAPDSPHSVSLTGVGNNAPVAGNDPANQPAYTVDENTMLSIPAPGVLANDSDPDGDPLTAEVVTSPLHGTLVLYASGGFEYTPTSGYYGSDSFTYRANDGRGGLSNVATVSITVIGVNDAPSLVPLGNVTVLEDSGAYSQQWATDISTGDNGQTLTIEVVAANTALFSVQPALSADGILTFTPAPNQFGQTMVTVTLTDDGGTDNGGDNTTTYTFTITVGSVNDAPSFTKGGDITVAEDSGQHTATSWASNFSAGPANESTQTLVYGTRTSNDAMFAVRPALNSSGTLTFTPAPNANGTVEVTLSVRDDGGTSNGGQNTFNATMTMTITPVNDAPTPTNDAVTAIKNRAQPIAAATLLRNDTDIDGDALTVSAVDATSTAGGTVTLIGDSLVYTPRTDFVGSDSFTYTVRDASGATATATVTVEVQDFYMTYLPMIASSATAPVSQPDLVGSFTLSPNKTSFSTTETVQINATVKNEGTAPAPGFWVDLYINPSSAPTSTNQPWNNRCGLSPCYGIAWYVPNGLAPGQSITLTSTADSYATGSTRWNGTFASGTSDIYMYVDSWNPDVATGAVIESNETNNRSELHGLVVTGTNVAPLGQAETVDLPPRPRRLDD